MLGRLDGFLINRVFQPTADAMAGTATPNDAARFSVTGAMVFVLAKMLASTATALPDWTVLLDLLALWGGMAVLRTLSQMSETRFNPLREQFGLARRVLALVTILLLMLGARSLVECFALMQSALWCMTLYFASCNPPQQVRVERPRRPGPR